MCNCIEEMQAKLKETGRNTQLDIPIVWDRSGSLRTERVAIKVCKLEESKREKPLPILPSYCPFCGEPYDLEANRNDTSGAVQIYKERQRQTWEEHFTPEHDARFTDGELIQASVAYALAGDKDKPAYDEHEKWVGGMAENTEAYAWWPWDLVWWKPKDRIRNLVRAGALLAAEIDRLEKLHG